MRYIQLEDDILYTPVVTYKYEKNSITCVGTIHIGNTEYYENIKAVNNIKHTYVEIANFFDASTQTVLSYPSAWVNSDIGAAKFVTEAPERVLKKIRKMPDSVKKLKDKGKDSPEDLNEIMKHIFKFSVKYPKFFSLFAPPVNKKYLVNRRNNILFNDLSLKIKPQIYENMGIVFGAGHLKGINKYLKQNGYKVESTEWLPALNLKTEKKFFDALKAIN